MLQGMVNWVGFEREFVGVAGECTNLGLRFLGFLLIGMV